MGRFDPLDWGLGFELRHQKTPHWTGTHNSPETFGHFGGAGGFLWVDPAVDRALVVLTDRDFGPWALEAWPALSDAVVAAVTAAGLILGSLTSPPPPLASSIRCIRYGTFIGWPAGGADR